MKVHRFIPEAILKGFLYSAIAWLVLTYVMICWVAGTPFPFTVPVHEDGKRTLLWTLLYFAHAARELPIDLLLGIALGGAATLVFSPRSPAKPNLYWYVAGFSTFTILIGSLFTVGATELWRNLAQSHTRPDAPLQFGSHWYYHFLSRQILIFATLGIALTLRGMYGAQTSRNLKPFWGIVIVHAVLSLLFLSSFDLLVSAFIDPVFLAHQAREILTHAVVTIPLSFWAIRQVSAAPPADGGALTSRSLHLGLGLLVLLALLAIYIGAASLSGGAMNEAQSSDLRVVVFPHFYEHAYSFVVTPALAVAVFLTFAKR